MAFINDFRVKNGLVVTTTATIEGTTNSTSTNTGALVVSGGIGVAQDIQVGGNTVLSPTSAVVFGDGTQQFTRSFKFYTNVDVNSGLQIEDVHPGDFYYDDLTESIYLMVDTGLGYNQLLDLTVRAPA